MPALKENWLCEGGKRKKPRLVRGFSIRSMEYLISLTALGIAAYTDWKTLTIPLWLFPAAAALCTILRLSFGGGPGMPELLLAAAILGISFLLLALRHGCGGDLLMAACLGWCLGYPAVWAVLLSSLIFLPLVLYFRKKGQREAPYAPALFLSLSIITGTAILMGGFKV